MVRHKRRSVAPPKVQGINHSPSEEAIQHNLPPGLEDRAVTRSKNGIQSRLARNNSQDILLNDYVRQLNKNAQQEKH